MLGERRLWVADLAPLPGWIAAVAAEKPMTLTPHRPRVRLRSTA